MEDATEPRIDDSMTATEASEVLMAVMEDDTKEIRKRFPSRLDAFLDGVTVGKAFAKSGA